MLPECKVSLPFILSCLLESAEMEIPYYDWIAHHASRTPDKIAVVDLAIGQGLTYQQFDRRITALSGYMASKIGIRRGDAVSVLAHNSATVLEIQFACFRLGAIFVPLNTRLALPELEFIIGDAAPRILLHDGEFQETAAELRKRFQGISLLDLGLDGTCEASIAEQIPFVPQGRAKHSDISTVLYTSGTTGVPKGVTIPHSMIFWNAANISPIAGITPTSIFLTVLPLFHTGGLNCYTNCVFLAGGTVVVMRTFDPAIALDILATRKYGVNLFFGVPSNYQFMAQCSNFESANFSDLIGGVGGAAMPVGLLSQYQSRGLAILQGYGMTETGPFVLCLGQEDATRKIGSAGKPVLHTEVKVVGKDGSPVQCGEIGEMLVRGPNVTPGYWRRPDSNASSFSDGWLRTGDLLYSDPEGFYYVADRSKDMYISGGENVYPAEVENALFDLPEIAEAAVIGVADPKWGEVGQAFVVLRAGSTITEEAIFAYCHARLAKFKCPRKITFLNELPRTSSGKAHKPTLRRNAQAMTDATRSEA